MDIAKKLNILLLCNGMTANKLDNIDKENFSYTVK